MQYQFSEDFAKATDSQDPLAKYRQEFIFPKHEAQHVKYFTGNSLGLQPRKARQLVLEELDDWGEYAVEGHTESRRPWLNYHENFTDSLARIVGAGKSEVVAMGGLTANLHLLMVSFYRPEGKRKKIMCESKAFPSDQYALRSQLRFHGFNPDEDLIEIDPDPATKLISDHKILEAIEQHKDELALIMFGGVNYYNGQFFDMAKITAKAHEVGAMAGWDLAHAAGNVPLHLHHWQVDFAAWCGYKYLNSGPGGVSGIFIHEKHHGKKDIPRFEGWWGHDKKTRFKMPDHFQPMSTAEAWQLSNAPVFAMTPLLASLELFDEVGMEALREKSLKLTGYLEFIIGKVRENTGVELEILTPAETQRRGCQLSVVIPQKGREIFDRLSARGVVADWREPDVIRLAPVPLYNSYEDVFGFGKILQDTLKEMTNG